MTKEALDANAADYVVFSTETDESIDDGLQYQAGKKAGLITNVNTVGFRADSSQSPVELSASAEMEALGFSGAQSLTRAPIRSARKALCLRSRRPMRARP